MASGRAARKPRKLCLSAASWSLAGANAATTSTASPCRAGATSVGPADVLTPDSHRLGGAEPEQVVLRAADQRTAAQSVVVELAVVPKPRTIATGIPPSLPFTRSAAAAISSAMATWVTSSTLP